MKRVLGMALVFAVGISAVRVAPATGATTGFGLGVHGGYGESKDAESGSPLAGGHMILNLAPWLGVVGMVDYKFEEDFGQDADAVQITSLPISAMARIYLPVGGFSPYLAAGVQYRLINYGGPLFEDTELDDSDSAFGWLAGAGAEFDLGESTEFFGELRYEASDPESDLDNAVEDAENLNYDQWNARVGLTFFLK